MDLFKKNIFGFYSNRFHKNNSDLYITSYFFEYVPIPFKIGEHLLKDYINKSNSKVIYVSSESDARNNRLTQGKEYRIIAFKRDGEGYYFRIKNDAGMEESYSVDFFSVKLIKKDLESTTDILISTKLAISDRGKLLKNG